MYEMYSLLIVLLTDVNDRKLYVTTAETFSQDPCHTGMMKGCPYAIVAITVQGQVVAREFEVRD